MEELIKELITACGLWRFFFHRQLDKLKRQKEARAFTKKAEKINKTFLKAQNWLVLARDSGQDFAAEWSALFQEIDSSMEGQGFRQTMLDLQPSRKGESPLAVVLGRP